MGDRRTNNDRKARQNEDFDFVSPVEQRKHRRVGSSAFGGIPLLLRPAPPFFGDPIKGKIIDLSGGGMAVLVPEMVPTKTKLKMAIAFPRREPLVCHVSVRRATPTEGGFLLGLQFLDLPDEVARELIVMSDDYDACDQRIRQDMPLCVTSCAFYMYCEKPQKSPSRELPPPLRPSAAPPREDPPEPPSPLSFLA